MADCKVSNGASVALLVTTPSAFAPPGGAGHGRGRSCGYIFVVDVAVLAAGSPLKQAMSIAIQSNLPHIFMQFGESINCPNCPLICCAVDTCAALTTGSFHFYAAIAKRFPHCIAKVFAPKDYAAIVLSGIVGHHNQAAMTTKFEVGFQFPLPYKTKDGGDASLVIATGSHVFVNTILGLPFVVAMGMIIDFVNNVADCRYLDCVPFPIDFQRTSNHVPVMDEPDASVNISQYNNIIREMENLERYYDAKVQAGSSKITPQSQAVHIGSKSMARAAVSDSDSVGIAAHPLRGIGTRWVPPSSVHKDDDEYHSSILGKDNNL
jgi:hypothetical protein